MCDNTAFPLNWKSFLRLDDNKKELYEYLEARVQSLRLPNLEVIDTAALDVINSTMIDEAGMTPCNHEEADTRIFVHVKYASVNCMKKILIRTVDTDVFVLAIAFLQKLDVQELRVATCRCTR